MMEFTMKHTIYLDVWVFHCEFFIALE